MIPKTERSILAKWTKIFTMIGGAIGVVIGTLTVIGYIRGFQQDQTQQAQKFAINHTTTTMQIGQLQTDVSWLKNQNDELRQEILEYCHK
jgi:hypothetical protein